MTDCKHHWMIDSKNVGTCKLCGEVREFQAPYSQKWDKDEMNHWMNTWRSDRFAPKRRVADAV